MDLPEQVELVFWHMEPEIMVLQERPATASLLPILTAALSRPVGMQAILKETLM
jgi:hypothetical protein